MVTYDCEVETQNLKDVLNSAGMRHGGPSVMVSGPPLMLMWLADSLDLFQQVDIICHTGTVHSKLDHRCILQEQYHATMPSLVKELVPFGLMTCSAVEMNSDL